MPSGPHDLPAQEPAAATSSSPAPTETCPSTAATGRRRRLGGAVATTATKLLPLLALLDSIQPQVANESVFRTRRKKIRAHFDLVYQELHAERPRHQALAHAFQALAELVREEASDISRDELKQAAKEVVLATLKNAPALLNAAHQARLLS